MLVVSIHSGADAGFDIRFDGEADAPATVRRPALDPAIAARATQTIRGDGTDEASEENREVGHLLFDWLFGVEGRPFLEEESGPIRLAIADRGLAALPWELMRDDTDALVARAFGLVRLSVKPGAAAAAAIGDWPIRMMVVIGCSVADEAEPVAGAGAGAAGPGPIGAAAELRAIRAELMPRWRSIDLEEVRRPTEATLAETLQRQQPHVLHFIGHGSVAGPPGLLITPDSGAEWVLNTVAINELLREHGAPKLVFLNTCRSAAEEGTARAVANAFLGAGTGAVVAMQGDVQGRLARLFATEFYRHVFGGWSNGDFVPAADVEKAVRAARRTVAADVEAEHSGHRAPAIPVLSLRVADARAAVPPLLPTIRWPNSGPFESCERFRQTMLYADAQPARRELIRWVFPPPPRTPGASAEPTEPPVLVLFGEAKTGKSFLAAWSMRSYAGRGDVRVRHVAVDHAREVTLLGLLRQIHDGEPGAELAADQQLLGEGLGPHAAFDRFNLSLANLIQTGVAGEWEKRPADAPSPMPFPEVPPNFSNRITDAQQDQLCGAFLHALEEIAAARVGEGHGPLLIAFDNFVRTSDGRTTSAPADAIDPIIGGIVLATANRWAAAPTVAPALRFMLACRKLDELPALRWKWEGGGGIGSGVRFVRLSDTIEHQDLADLTREMYWFADAAIMVRLAPLTQAAMSPGKPRPISLIAIKQFMEHFDAHSLARHMQ